MKLINSKKKYRKFNQPKTYESTVLCLPHLGFQDEQIKQSVIIRKKAGILISFIMLLGIFLTLSTLIYYYKISENIIHQRKEIIQLYNHLQSIKLIKNQSQVFLEQLQQHRIGKNNVYLLVDNENIMNRESQEMKEAFDIHLQRNHTLSTEQNIYTPFMVFLGSLLIVLLIRFVSIVKQYNLLNIHFVSAEKKY